MDFGLAGRSFNVTGGSSGIGLAATRRLLDEKAVVTICGRDLDRLRARRLSDGQRRDPHAVWRWGRGFRLCSPMHCGRTVEMTGR